MSFQFAPARPLDTLWQARAVMWIILAGEALAVIVTIAPRGGIDALPYFGMASFAIQWIFLASLGLLYVCRRRLYGAAAPTIAQAGLGALLVSTWLACGLAWLALRSSGLVPPGGWFRVAIHLTGLALTVGLLALAAFQAQWRMRQLALRAKQAELEALQARIRPHFLFNTLNTATALLHHRPEDAERMLLDLADLFRAALAGPREISLTEELALVRRYLEIERQRFGERLRVDWELPNTIPEVRVPSLSIQPLVENAIRHGVERVPQGARVTISLSQTAAHVVVRIGNPLVLGAEPGPLSHGVGLSAARVRIEALTQGRGGVETGVQGEHYVATVRLPRPHPANFRD